MRIAFFFAAYAACASLAAAQDADTLAKIAREILPQARSTERSTDRPMSLAEIEEAALASNPDIRLMSERLARARAQVPGTLSIADPMFMYRAWGTPLTQPWNVNGTQHMFMFSQTFPASGKRELRFEAASQDVETAAAELEDVKQDIVMQVRMAFYDLLRNYDELKLYADQTALARQAVSTARSRYVVGKVAQYDVLKAQVALTQLADRLVRFRQNGDIARLTLNTLMGRDPAAALEVDGDYALPTTLPENAQLQQLALDNRPELQALATAIRASETLARLADRGRKPDITVSTGFMVMPSGAPKRAGYMAEVSLGLPWLNRSKYDFEVDEAAAEVRVRRAELDARKSSVFRQIQEARIRADSAEKLVDLYRQTLRPQAEATLRAVAAAYQTDRTDFLSLIDSQNTLLDVEYSYYRALSEFDARISELERATGVPLLRDLPARKEVGNDEN